MPFQSEKQRRYLHANHPEIAKRWERDYANGGISNHFRRKYFSGAYGQGAGDRGGDPRASRAQNIASGHVGGGGGGGNGGGGNGHHAPVYTGPSPAEIAAAKAAAEAAAAAAKKAADIKAHKEWITKKGKEKKKKVEYRKSRYDTGEWDEIDTGLTFADLGIDEFSTDENIKLAKVYGKPELTKWGATPGTFKDTAKFNDMEKYQELANTMMGFDPVDGSYRGKSPDKIRESIELGQSLYGIDMKNIPKDFLQTQKDFKDQKILGNIKFKEGGIANHFKKRVKLQDSVESMSDEEFKMMYPDWDPTQFTQEDYLQYISENEGNGVLDLSSDDQAIEFASTETDEIIPDLIAPGSASGILKFAKDGGNIRLQPHTATDLLVKKTSTGERPKYQPPGYGGPTGQETRGDTRGRDPDPGDHRERPDVLSTPVSQPSVTPTVITTTDDRGDGDAREKYISEQYKTKYDPYAGTDLEEQREIDRRNAFRRLQSKNISKQERKNLEVGVGIRKPKGPPNPLKTLGKLAAFWASFGATGLIEVPEIVQLAGTTYQRYTEMEAHYNKYKHLIPEKYGMKDVTWDDIVSKATGTVKETVEELKAKQDLINSLPKGHPERILLEESLDYGPYKKTEDRDGDGDEEIPRVEEITEELIEATEEGDAVDIMSVWDRIKNRQAKRSMLVEQGIIQGEPIALANSGGLANLFRVKNQY